MNTMSHPKSRKLTRHLTFLLAQEDVIRAVYRDHPDLSDQRGNQESLDILERQEHQAGQGNYLTPHVSLLLPLHAK